MAFKLFLLINATLFIRPAEIVPALEGLPVYNALISICLLVAFGKLSTRISISALTGNPIDACVVGLLVAVLLSNLTHLNLARAMDGGFEFAKVVVYYFLLVSIVDSPAKFRGFLRLIAACTVILTVLALLQYYGLIDIPSLQSIGDIETDPATGQRYTVLRLCSTGIYHDPNDLCLILLVGMGISAYELGGRAASELRFLWIIPLVLFGFALTKTHSRGGFLGLLSSMGVFFFARFGLKRSIPIALAALPVVFILFAGRQTSISTADDTGQDRIQLWSAGMLLFRESPLFGIGQNRYAEEVGLVAHNSFIHGFTELGLFGGTLFAGSFYYALATLQKLGPWRILIADPELRRFRPYLMAIVAAYSTCMLSISRNYVIPTYMTLGLVSVYLRLATRDTPIRPTPVNSVLLFHFIGISGAFMIIAYLFVRTFAKFGG